MEIVTEPGTENYQQREECGPTGSVGAGGRGRGRRTGARRKKGPERSGCQALVLLALCLYACAETLAAKSQPLNHFQQAGMKVIAAYLLAILGGNPSPSIDDLKHILGSVGAKADYEKIELLLTEVKGKDITEIIASGREKLASVPCGGGAVAVATAPAGGVTAGGAAPAAETKEENKVEEKGRSEKRKEKKECE